MHHLYPIYHIYAILYNMNTYIYKIYPWYLLSIHTHIWFTCISVPFDLMSTWCASVHSGFSFAGSAT